MNPNQTEFLALDHLAALRRDAAVSIERIHRDGPTESSPSARRRLIRAWSRIVPWLRLPGRSRDGRRRAGVATGSPLAL
jgi:hypothetical protein